MLSLGKQVLSLIGAVTLWLLHGFKRTISEEYYGPNNKERVFTWYMMKNTYIGFVVIIMCIILLKILG